MAEARGLGGSIVKDVKEFSLLIKEGKHQFEEEMTRAQHVVGEEATISLIGRIMSDFEGGCPPE